MSRFTSRSLIHAGYRLKQGVRHHLPRLLAVGFLSKGSRRHQSGKAGLQVPLPLLFGIHESRAGIQEIAQVKPILGLRSARLWNLPAAQQRPQQVTGVRRGRRLTACPEKRTQQVAASLRSGLLSAAE